MYNNITIKLEIRISLKSEDITRVLDDHGGWYQCPRSANAHPIDFITSSNQVVSGITLPFNLECDDCERMADLYAQFVSQISLDEGVYTVSCCIGDLVVANFKYIAIWDFDHISIDSTRYEDTLDIIDHVYKMWSNLGDKVNSHYSELFQNHPNYHGELEGKHNE